MVWIPRMIMTMMMVAPMEPAAMSKCCVVCEMPLRPSPGGGGGGEMATTTVCEGSLSANAAAPPVACVCAKVMVTINCPPLAQTATSTPYRPSKFPLPVVAAA